MATTADDSASDSESEEVFSELTRNELEDSLSELLENYSQLKIKYKKLRKNLVSEIEQLKLENSELKENNIKLKNDFQKIPSSEVVSSSKNILKEYDYSFQKFLASSIERSKMASMIYGFSRNNRKGLGYKAPRGKEIYEPKSVDEMKITYKPLHKIFKFSHTHDIKYTSCSKYFNVKPKFKQNFWNNGHTHKYTSHSERYYVKLEFKQNFWNTNHKGPRRIWVPK